MFPIGGNLLLYEAGELHIRSLGITHSFTDVLVYAVAHLWLT